MIPLSFGSLGEKLHIQKIAGKDDVRQHLAELGFVVGSEITIISVIGGNMILSVKDCRVALDKAMANRIFI